MRNMVPARRALLTRTLDIAVVEEVAHAVHERVASFHHEALDSVSVLEVL